MLKVDRVEKRFGTLKAVDGVSLEVHPGEVLGLLGPNGAGKTTTVSMIAGLLLPDAGEVRIHGRKVAGDRDPLKRSLGLVPQEIALYEDMGAMDNLELFGNLYGMGGAALRAAADRVLVTVGLQDRARERVSGFSGGMKRRLNLAAALLHDPELLILDEPTAGVDPQSRNAIFETLEALRSQGKALVYTTHYMEEAERLCDRIIIMDNGRILAQDTLAGLLGLVPASGILAVDLADAAAPLPLDELRSLPWVAHADLTRGRLRAGLREPIADTRALLGWLAERDLGWSHLEFERANLESVFLALTGRSLRDA